MRASALVILSVALVACGGGGDGPAPLDLTGVSAVEGTTLALDERIDFGFSGPVPSGFVENGGITIRRSDGQPARGTFVRGRVLLDRNSGSRVIVDPSALDGASIARIERTGDAALVAPDAWYDIGSESAKSGNRLVLMDHSIRDLVLFYPEVPARAELSDAGYTPGETWEIRVRRANRRDFRRTFRTESADSAAPFTGGPVSQLRFTAALPPWRLYFDEVLDPRTVVPENFPLSVAAVPGLPRIPCSVSLRQSWFGSIEVTIVSQEPLPSDADLVLGPFWGVRDIAGNPLGEPGATIPFRSEPGGVDLPPMETFDTPDRRDGAHTSANWGDTVPGSLVAEALPDRVSSARSLWYETYFDDPDYEAPEAVLDTARGTVEILVQAGGDEPTEWVPFEEIDRLDGVPDLRFEVWFRTPADWKTVDPLPRVDEIRVIVGNRTN